MQGPAGDRLPQWTGDPRRQIRGPSRGGRRCCVPELLRLELGELKLSGFDLSLTGFGDLELKNIMADRNAGAGRRRRWLARTAV
jgi:hypothetical protein